MQLVPKQKALNVKFERKTVPTFLRFCLASS